MIIRPEFNDQELQSLMGLIDLGCKAGGIQVAKAASSILDKLTEAVEAAKAEANVITMPDKDAA